MNKTKYIGDELDLFSKALNWKKYWGNIISFFISNDVLEVGSGNGNNTIMLQGLAKFKLKSWLCLEPDDELLSVLSSKISSESDSAITKTFNGTIDDLDENLQFDAILYIDVLEHIRDDQQEINNASAMLNNSGKLIVLAPAHQFLYSEFDKSIGHYRRYNTSTLKKLTPDNCRIVFCRYLDSVGMIASILNRVLLKTAHPSSLQIQIWDSVLVRASKILDKLFWGKVGKTILVIWERID